MSSSDMVEKGFIWVHGFGITPVFLVMMLCFGYIVSKKHFRIALKRIISPDKLIAIPDEERAQNRDISKKLEPRREFVATKITFEAIPIENDSTEDKSVDEDQCRETAEKELKDRPEKVKGAKRRER